MDFFTKLFKKKDEDMEIKLADLSEWFLKNSKDALKERNSDLKEAINYITESKKRISYKLEKLENASLLNEKIPENEKHTMEGNRENYLRRANSFLDVISIPDIDYETIQLFCTGFDITLLKFNDETAKAYYILNHFFGTEMKEIAVALKDLSDSIENIKELLTDKKISSYRSILKEIRELDESLIKDRVARVETEELSLSLEDTKKRKEILDRKLLMLKKSFSYTELLDSEKKIGMTKQEIENLNNTLNSALKSIEKPLKKLIHENFEADLINSYLDSPLATLYSDTGKKNPGCP
jgi:hypothetical protein